MDAPAKRILDIWEDLQAPIFIGAGKTPFPDVQVEEGSDVVNALKKVIWVDLNYVTGWRSAHNASEPILSKAARPGGRSSLCSLHQWLHWLAQR